KFKIRGKRSDLHARRGTDATAPIPDPRPPITDPRSPIPDRIQDCVASMHEVVQRRYRKVLENGGPFPDLIVIDGGKGQLSAAYAGLGTVGLWNLVAIGLAKKEELVFTRDSMEPLALDPHGAALRLLQRIRDAAHRFAITLHRQSRKKRDLQSTLHVAH